MANLRLPIDLAPITDGLRTVTETLKVVRDSAAKELAQIDSGENVSQSDGSPEE